MVFKENLVHGKLLRRYKRFLADVELDDGTQVVAHCTNSGSMKSCLEVGAEVYLTPVDDPKRKTRFTWEMIKINGTWVGINTGNPNILAAEAIQQRSIPGMDFYSEVRREVRFQDSRFDVLASNDTEQCFIEVKNVSMKDGRYALFPDAVTVRGRKHLNTLVKVKNAGLRAVMFYVVQRCDVDRFAPAREIDPDYALALEEAMKQGVEVFVLQVRVTPHEIKIIRTLPVDLFRKD